MWRIDSLGVRAEDFINKDGNPVNDTYGQLWKMADPADQAKLIDATVEQPAPPPKSAVEGDHRYAESELELLSKVQLSEIAASLGVSDITMPKARMVQTILLKQG